MVAQRTSSREADCTLSPRTLFQQHQSPAPSDVRVDGRLRGRPQLLVFGARVEPLCRVHLRRWRWLWLWGRRWLCLWGRRRLETVEYRINCRAALQLAAAANQADRDYQYESSCTNAHPQSNAGHLERRGVGVAVVAA